MDWEKMMLLYVGGQGYKQFKEVTVREIKFQDWFTQEYLSWAKEGKPDGWTGRDEVDMGIFKCDVDVMFHNEGQEILTLSFKPLPIGGRM